MTPQTPARSYSRTAFMCVITALICFLFILFSLRVIPQVRAQGTPTPTPTPTATPSFTCSPTPTTTASPSQPPYSCATCSPPPLPMDEVAIPSRYQGNDRGTLAWEVYPPSPTPTPSPGYLPPGIVMVHGSGWNAGSSHDFEGIARTLSQNGYYVVSVNYELAPCGLIPMQQCHSDDVQTPGWWVNREVQDLEAFVTALRDSGQVNPDRIGIVGGSAGATLALLAVLDTTDTGSQWPYWNAGVRPACAVLFSPVTDFSDRTPSEGEPEMAPSSIRAIENFTQTTDPGEQRLLSPISKVMTPTSEIPFVPTYIIHSQNDPTVPFHNLDDLICAFQSKSVDTSLYQALVLWGSDLHSFYCWNSCDNPEGATPSCTLVSTDVIEYLDANLK